MERAGPLFASTDSRYFFNPRKFVTATIISPVYYSLLLKTMFADFSLVQSSGI